MSAFAQTQSKLPPCPSIDYSKNTHLERYGKWHNCFGRYVAELNDTYKGDVFIGEFKNGLPNGQGTQISANGGGFIGEWKDGKPNGNGIKTYADGRKPKEGIFENGKFILEKRIDLTILGNQIINKEFSPSFDCRKAKSTSEKLICSNEDLSTLDRELFTLYKQAKQTTSDQEFFKKETVAAWLKREKECIDKQCLFNWYESRRIHYNKIIGVVNTIISSKNLISNNEPNNVDHERIQQIEEHRSREETKRTSAQAKQTNKLSLQAFTTKPDTNGNVIITVRTNADTSSLKVNGEEQGGRSDGNYVIKKVARVGQDTNYLITAVDTNGNSDSTTITVARQTVSSNINQTASLKPESIKRTATRDAVAIIIGIQNYKRVPKADFANSDAKEFYEYAIRGLGIKPENIKLLVDEEADDIEIVKALQNWLPLKVTKDKTDVYVFYSGHGLPSEDGQSLYFLPYGVDKQFLARTAVGQKEVVSSLVASKPKSVTMFIDACYSGQTRGGETLLASAKPIALKTDTNVFPSNFTVISASANDQISSSSPELKHGIFSFYLMKGMEGDADGNKDGKITAGEMQEYLSDKVSRQAMSMSRKQDTQLVGDSNKVLMVR